MSQIIISATDDIIRHVFQLGRVAPATTQFTEGGPNTPVGDEVTAALEQAWHRLQQLTLNCWRKGLEDSKTLIAEVTESIIQTARDLGAKGKQFVDLFIRKVREAIATMFQLMLDTLQSEIKIGQVTYKLKSVALEQKVVSTGSLEFSIHTLCKAAASGELVVKGSYEAVPAL
jgi:hypothetical protein